MLESVGELENRIEDLIDHIEKMHSRDTHICHHKLPHMHHFGSHGCPTHHPHHQMHPHHMHGCIITAKDILLNRAIRVLVATATNCSVKKNASALILVTQLAI